MSDSGRHIAIVLLPLIFTNIFHMGAVKLNWFGYLKIPVWPSVFGENKTWRGFLFVPLVNAFILLSFSFLFSFDLESPFLMGLFLGLAYVVSELPNSFLKRRLGIRSGESHSTYKYLFYIIDKTDSALGVSLLYFMMSGISPKVVVLLFVTCSLTHVLISLLLVRLKLKSAF